MLNPARLWIKLLKLIALHRNDVCFFIKKYCTRTGCPLVKRNNVGVHVPILL